jgi:Peptidase family M28
VDEGVGVDTDERRSRKPWIILLISTIPLWLVLSSGVGIFLYIRNEEHAKKVEQPRTASSLSEKELADFTSKLVNFAGERHPLTESGKQGLLRASALIEGTLGPSNVGYKFTRLPGPETEQGQFPILIATLRGREEHSGAIWLVAPYDTRSGSHGADVNASGVASVMALAQAMAAMQPEHSIHFAFIPHGENIESPVMATFDRLRKQIDSPPAAVLLVESMGAKPQLMVSSRDATNPVLGLTQGLGVVVGAEAVCLQDDLDATSALFEIGLPAVRIATRLPLAEGEVDQDLPEPKTHLAATQALLQLVQRLQLANGK